MPTGEEWWAPWGRDLTLSGIPAIWEGRRVAGGITVNKGSIGLLALPSSKLFEKQLVDRSEGNGMLQSLQLK
jgi:hypothetical protein